MLLVLIIIISICSVVFPLIRDSSHIFLSLIARSRHLLFRVWITLTLSIGRNPILRRTLFTFAISRLSLLRLRSSSRQKKGLFSWLLASRSILRVTERCRSLIIDVLVYLYGVLSWLRWFIWRFWALFLVKGGKWKISIGPNRSFLLAFFFLSVTITWMSRTLRIFSVFSWHFLLLRERFSRFF